MLGLRVEYSSLHGPCDVRWYLASSCADVRCLLGEPSVMLRMQSVLGRRHIDLHKLLTRLTDMRDCSSMQWVLELWHFILHAVQFEQNQLLERSVRRFMG